MAKDIQEKVREISLQRISRILQVPIASLASNSLFREIHNPRSVSQFSRNAFDILLDDIRDVSSAETLRGIDEGVIEINTVDDYVQHMQRCYSESPKMVVSVIGEVV